MRVLIAAIATFLVSVAALEPSPALAQTAGTLQLVAGTGSGQIVAMHSGLCLAPTPGGGDGAAVTQQACGVGPEQIWDAKTVKGGYQLVNRANGKCLDLYGAFPTDGTAIIQYACWASSSNQVWSGVAYNGGSVIVSSATGKCIDIYGASAASGAAAVQWSCNGGANEVFLTPASAGNGTAGTATEGGGLDLVARTGSGQIRASHSGLCLSVPPGDTGEQTPVTQQPCGSGPEQIWDATPIRNGVILTNRRNKFCLNSGVGTSDWTPVIQHTCFGGGPKEVWVIVPYRGGYLLLSSETNRCLDVTNAAVVAGTALIQYSCNGGANQVFTTPGPSAPVTASGTGGTGTGSGTAGTGSAAAAPPGEVPLSGSVLLVNRQSGMCVASRSGQPGTSPTVAQTACYGASAETWSFTASGAGYQVKNLVTGSCLSVDGGSTAVGAGILQGTCGSSTAGGSWQLRKVGQWYELVGAQSQRCVGVTDGSREDGAVLSQVDCTGGDPQRFSIVSANFAPSSWTAPRTLGIVPVSAAPLPNGKLLMWGGEGRTTFGFTTVMWTTLYDPAADTSVDTFVTNATQAFCPGTNILPDGRIMTTGGSYPGATAFYDPTSNAWSLGSFLNIPRGYNGNTTLSTGESLTYGGSWSGDLETDKAAEVLSPTTGQWRVLKQVSSETAAVPYKSDVFRDNHYWLFAAAGGFAFNAGPGPKMFWIDTRGDGAIAQVGTRGDDGWSQSGTASMYDVGRILKIGGAPGPLGEIANDNAYTIDITAGPGSLPQVAKLDAAPFARTVHNSVVLPSGEVVTIGGQSMQANFTDLRAVMIPDIWSPTTGKFRLLAPMTVPRNYHSFAVLMPDGRVASGGGGLCGGCPGDHPDVQFLSPPYLFDSTGKLAARPTITTAPTSAVAGSTLSVATDRNVASFALVRMSATTHTVNGDQRRVPLSIASSSGTTYQLPLPAERGTLLPGPWMLFAMDANGVPSVSKIVRIQ